MEARMIERLFEKVEVCDRALSNLAFSDRVGHTPVERAIREVRADAVDRLLAYGHAIADIKP